MAFAALRCGGLPHDGGGAEGDKAPTGPSAGPGVKTMVVDIGPLKIDKIYRSMDGPFDRVPFDPADVGWITRFSTEVIERSSGDPVGEEFFCHSQLQLDNLTRLLVTATGIAELRFPEGFAMPLANILTGVPQEWRGLSLLGMVLNNHEPDSDRNVNVRVTLDYLSPDDPASRKLKKLFKVEIPLVADDGTVVTGDPPREVELEAYKGIRGHWIVPPGRYAVRQVHRQIVPIASTVHYAVVHLHNHGISMRLTDATEGRLLWETRTVYESDRVQIAEIPVYSSTEGFRIYPDHDYEIEAIYDNTSESPVDAMAAIYLYYNPDGNVDISYPAPPPDVAGPHATH
jgi:hypothetical protein